MFFLENVVFFEIGRSGGFQESELRARRGGANSVLVNAVAGQFFGQAEFSRNIFQFDLKDVRIEIAWTTCLWTFTLSEILCKGVKLESLLRFIFTCSGPRSLHLSNHKNCLLNKDQYFHIFGVMDDICFRMLWVALWSEAWWITIIPLFCKSNYFT